MNSSIDEVAEALGELGQRNYPVASLTTYKVGGTAALFCRVDDVETLMRVAQIARDSSTPLVVLGRGFCATTSTARAKSKQRCDRWLGGSASSDGSPYGRRWIARI